MVNFFHLLLVKYTRSLLINFFHLLVKLYILWFGIEYENYLHLSLNYKMNGEWWSTICNLLQHLVTELNMRPTYIYPLTIYIYAYLWDFLQEFGNLKKLFLNYYRRKSNSKCMVLFANRKEGSQIKFFLNKIVFDKTI